MFKDLARLAVECLRKRGSLLRGFKALDSPASAFKIGLVFLTVDSGGCECNRLAGPHLCLALHGLAAVCSRGNPGCGSH